MKNLFSISSVAALALITGACAGSMASGVASAPPQLQGIELLPAPERDPSELQVLFWSQEERAERFR